MTESESIQESDRSVSLFIKKDDPVHSLLVTEVARLLRYWVNETNHINRHVSLHLDHDGRVTKVGDTEDDCN